MIPALALNLDLKMSLELVRNGLTSSFSPFILRLNQGKRVIVQNLRCMEDSWCSIIKKYF